MSFLSDFRAMMIGILLESFPFVLLGIIISALLQTLISDQTLQRWISKKTIPGILFGCLLGILFPLCECGIIPVVHRLIRKGMPPYIGIVFMMAGPIINPVVFTSTFVAFRTHPEMAIARIALAFAVAAVIELWAAWRVRDTALRTPLNNAHEQVPQPAPAQSSRFPSKLRNRLGEINFMTRWSTRSLRCSMSANTWYWAPLLRLCCKPS